MNAAPDMFDPMQMSAVFGGPGDMYRLELTRLWDAALPMLPVAMLNPSWADHRKNDPTVTTLIHFGKLWGYGGVLIVNMYAYRSPSPKVMFAARERSTPENERFLVSALEYAAGTRRQLLAAWGTDGDREGAASRFAALASAFGVGLVCLGTTKDGAPKHPMARGVHRIPRDQMPIEWRQAA